MSDSNYEVSVQQRVKLFVYKSEILDSKFGGQLGTGGMCYRREKVC